ncbi:hypothetical protein Rsub_00478 [Raphidocelis subcapitata]|uniref:VPS10 domain-containing protein n=1 Tax=Raphidocelis subcapitata TaxID=307507 RepID=A0A2V0NS54_9CHLO|nr:hypothetical protein Rsub_00478 [Raphidocelis subcapitata]|eukprot:GBF87767.1 hypothetical protein Rsub_00478 [Raphidocelis subcapitata]
MGGRTGLHALAWALVLACGLAHASGRELLDTCDSQAFAPLKPSKFESKVSGVEWVGADDQNVFVVTLQNRIWRSKDGGSNFEDITERFKASIKEEEPVAIVRVVAHQTTPGATIFIGAGVYSWVSKDFGETLTPVKHPGGFKGAHVSVRANRLQPDWMLWLAKRPDCHTLDDYQIRCPLDLFVSKTAFVDLKLENLTASSAGKIAGFVDYDWGVEACGKQGREACAALGIGEETVFATMFEKAGDWDSSWDPDVHFVRSDDYFRSMRSKVQCGNQFELLGSSIYLAVSNKCPVNPDGSKRTFDKSGLPGITLYTSVNGATEFQAACLPVLIKQEGYELLETHDGKGTVIIVDYLVRSTMMMMRVSSAYSAGPQHQLFSLSLNSIYRQDATSAASDFMRVEGVPGVFIANQMASRREGDDSISDLSDRPVVYTRMTFNGGGTWQNIKAPTKFNSQKCNRCGGRSDDCYLHLHGASSWFFGSVQFPSVYSHPSSPGLLVGTGNVASQGLGLEDGDGACTWLSYDGGFSWTDVAEGTFIYEYADWGGVVVMGRHELSGPADEVLFSVDYGRCWRRVPLESALTLENIRIEPDGQRPKVLLHGRACRRSAHPNCSYAADDTRATLEGVVYALDVKALLGDKLPACSASDYEQWTVPNDDRTQRCLLGQQMSFTRRRQDAACLNGGDYKRPVPTNTSCACTAADVECDWGWVRDDGKCTRLPEDKLPTCPRVQDGSYYVSGSGFRLVHGDVCSGVDGVIPDSDGQGNPKGGGRPPSRRHGGRSGLFTAVMVAAALAGTGAAWYHFAASSGQRAAAREVGGAAAAFCAGLWALAADAADTALARLGARAGGLRFGGGGGGGGGAYAPVEDDELSYFVPLESDEARALVPPQPPVAPGGLS